MNEVMDKIRKFIKEENLEKDYVILVFKKGDTIENIVKRLR